MATTVIDGVIVEVTGQPKEDWASDAADYIVGMQYRSEVTLPDWMLDPSTPWSLDPEIHSEGE